MWYHTLIFIYVLILKFVFKFISVLHALGAAHMIFNLYCSIRDLVP